MSRIPIQKSSQSLSKKIQIPPQFDPNRYTTKNLTTDDIKKLKQCFDVFDYQKMGTISLQQLIIAIKSLGLQKDADKILKIAQNQSDVNQLDFSTFLQLFGFTTQLNSQKTLKQLFQIFDQQKNGAFGQNQLKFICQEVGQRFTENQLENMILFADKDKDKKISYQEFVDVVTKQYPII